MGYKVAVDALDVIDKDAGEYPDGRPKRVFQVFKGDDVPVDKIGEQRVQELIDAGAIAEEEPEEAPAKAEGTTKKSS